MKNKKIYFRLLSWVLIGLIFVLLEICLRIFSVGQDLHLFVEHEGNISDQYLKVNPHVGEKYFTRFEATSGTSDMFLKQKPDSAFRIFLLGSSTLYGYPYDRNLMASRILLQRLRDAYPEKAIEVVNTSITAINSTTLRDYIKQVLKQEPDAILIYAGHNEYYGAFGIGSNETMSRNPFLLRVHFKLINLRIYQLLRSAIGGVSERLTGNGVSEVESGTLMERIVNDEDIVYQGEKYLAGLVAYRSNMSYILRKAQNDRIPVFISDLVSNIRDIAPFGSVGEAGEGARTIYNEAWDLLATGDTLSARSLFYQAKDLDPIRFRASEELNDVIADLAEEFGAIQIPAIDWFTNNSADGLIGNDLLTEHVHPNIQGQFVLADAFFSTILASGLAGGVPAPGTLKSSGQYQKQWPYTDLDSLIGVYKINHLKSHWPFAPIGSEVIFRDTFQASGYEDSLAFSILIDPEASAESLHMQLAEYLGEQNELYGAFEEYKALISIDPYRASYFTLAASILLMTNDLSAAEYYLRESMKLENNYLSYSILGEIETIKHNFASAASQYRKAIELGNRRRKTDEKWATTLPEIEKKLDQVITLSRQPLPDQNTEYSRYIPRNIQRLYMHALTLTPADPDSALATYRQCLMINDCPLVNYRIGDLLYMKQDLSLMHYYEKAFEGFSHEPDFLVRYCVASIYNQKMTKAREIFRLLSEISPGHKDLPRLSSALG